MKSTRARIRALMLGALAILFICPALAQKPYEQLKFPKLHNIRIPEVKQLTLENGIRLFLLEDHELPLINLSARIRTGSIYEPADKVGLASITGRVMRTGGTTSRTGDEIDELLESIAASVETSIGESSGSASMSVLKRDLDTGLEILADVLMHPAFRQEKLDLAKVQARSAIARRNDSVGAVAIREFSKLIYGADSVWARQEEYATIDKITRDDLVAFHQRFYHPNNVMMAVWGDFDQAQMVEKIRHAFAGWPKAEVEIPPTPKVHYQFRKSVNLVKKDDVNQTNIYLGHIGTTLDDPDYFALVLMNRILGSGGFTSRLFREVRSRQGLAYSVFGRYSANFNYPGMFFVGCQTKSGTTVKAIRAMINEVRKMTESEVTDEELETARESYLNSFVFRFDSTGEIVSRIMTYAYYGYPLDFLQKTKANLEKVTKADVLRVAQAHLHPDQLQILAVGRPGDFDEPLSVLGEVHNVDITIPEPKAEAVPEATAETRARGREMLGRMAQAMGASGIENYSQDLDIVIVAPQGEMKIGATRTLVFPDKMAQVMKTPMGEMSQVVSGKEAWVRTAQGTRDVPGSQHAEMAASLYRDLVTLGALHQSKQLQVQYLGSQQVEQQKVEVLSITDPNGKSMKLFLDARSFLPLKQTYQGRTMTGPAQLEVLYSDFRDISGLKVPFKTRIRANGKRAMELNVKATRVNGKIDPATFQKK